MKNVLGTILDSFNWTQYFGSSNAIEKKINFKLRTKEQLTELEIDLITFLNFVSKGPFSVQLTGYE